MENPQEDGARGGEAPGNVAPKNPLEIIDSTPGDAAPASELGAVEPPKRKRGRPPKDRSSEPPRIKRPRGRPRKYPAPLPRRPGPGRPSNEELAVAWAAKPVERQPVARNPDGTLKKGAVLNPGALTNSQARIKQMLEGATVPMISRLLELAQSDNEQVALGAVREWMTRCAAP